MIEGDALRPSGRSQTGRSKLARCGILLLASASFLVSSCGDRLAAAQAGADRRSPEAAQLQTVDFAEFPSTPWRKSAAHALLADCEAGLTAVPPALPSVRLTEDGPGGIAALRREFARWQVATIFTGCAELMQEILAAEDARQETRAWVEAAHLLDNEQMILNLIVTAGVRAAGRDGDDAENISGIGHWRTVRGVIFKATLGLLDPP